MVIYVPGTEETDQKKQNMSLQQLGGAIATIGAYLSATLASGSAVALTTGVAADVISLALPVGDWDVEGMVSFNSGTTTTASVLAAYISAASATVPTSPNNTTPFGGGGMSFWRASFAAGGATNFAQVPTGAVRVNLAAPATVYLGTIAGFAVNSLSAFGVIRARRAVAA